MDPSSRYIRFLSPVPAFAGLDPAQLKRLYGFTALKVLAKGEAATVARVCVAELAIVVSGRVGERGKEPDAEEFGPGAVLEAQAFFTQRPAAATLIALRETVLLTLGWDDLAAAFHAHPDLLACCFAGIGVTAAPAPGKAARLVFCPAGAKGRLDAEAKSALVSALETLAEVRILRRESFGSLALDAPETAHWLQEQELEFDVTVIVAEGADDGFAKEAIGEADEILFIASSGSSILSPLEQYALEQRGKERCRLAIAKSKGMSLKNAAEWLPPRPYRSTQFVDFASPAAVALTASALIGKGHAVAATSRGVYAAAILGALQAFEANGAPAVSLCAAGSAVLPAGLLACGASLAETETAFRELANPLLWKRAARAEAGLYEAAPIDNVLASALPGWNIGLQPALRSSFAFAVEERGECAAGRPRSWRGSSGAHAARHAGARHFGRRRYSRQRGERDRSADRRFHAALGVAVAFTSPERSSARRVRHVLPAAGRGLVLPADALFSGRAR